MYAFDVSRMDSVVRIPDSVYKTLVDNIYNTYFILEYTRHLDENTTSLEPEGFIILTCGNCGDYISDPENIKGRLAIEKIPNFTNNKEYYDAIVDALLHSKTTILENYNWRNLYIDKDLTFKIFPVDKHIVGIVVRNEIEIIDAQNKAKEAIDLKNLFTANMSHEIRTPLSAIIGLTKLFENTELNSMQKQYLRYMNQSCNALMAIVNDILDYAKLEGGRVKLYHEDFIIRNLINETCKIIEDEAISKHITITKFIHTNVPHCCMGDPNRLSQVLLNLLSNAIKFTKDGGHISIKVKLDTVTSDNKVKIHFAVKDDGIGITKDDQNKLFQPYSQIDNTNTKKYKGAGLGLLIAKKLVNLMDGEIWVESNFGVGSTFGFYITANSCKNSNTLVTEELKKLVIGKSVLIVDDDAVNRLQLIKMVKSWGMIPSVACSVLEAQYLLEDSSFDLGLIDIVMPELGGNELAEIIRNNKFEFPLIALSSLEESDLSFETKFTSILNKPIDQEKLENVVLNVLSYESNRSPLRTFKKYNFKILSAEDHQSNQMIICKYLESMGMTDIHTAQDGKEAVDKCMDEMFDVIFMNIKMPIMDGLTAEKLIKSHYQHINHKCYFVALTAQAMEEDEAKYKNDGFDGYISKPINIDKLKMLLDSINLK